MNKPAFPQRILIAGLLLAACFTALWFSGTGGTDPRTAADGATGNPSPASFETPVTADEGVDPAGVVPAPTDRDDPSVPRGVNGTNLYLKASALLKQLSESEKKMIKQPREEVAEAEAKALYEKLRPVLALIHDAARADYYDWGLGEVSIDKPMPQYRIIIELAQAALWSAAYRFAEDPAGAIEDLAARAKIPRSETSILIGGLVASTIERSALDVIRENAAHLNASTLERARTFVTESTFNEDARRSFEGEATMSDSFFNKIAAMVPEERLKWAPSVWGEKLEPAAAKVLLDNERLADEVRLVKKFTAQMAEAMSWPDAQFKAWNSEFRAGLSDYPLAAISLPALDGVRDAFRRVQVEREMLGTGLSILADGPAAAALARDPGTGNPFSYTTTAAGFELRSPTLDEKGKPISMRFAAPK